MKKKEIIIELSKHDLDWDMFLQYMNGKELEVTVDKGISFYKRDVDKFIDISVYNKQNNYN